MGNNDRKRRHEDDTEVSGPASVIAPELFPEVVATEYGNILVGERLRGEEALAGLNMESAYSLAAVYSAIPPPLPPVPASPTPAQRAAQCLADQAAEQAAAEQAAAEQAAAEDDSVPDGEAADGEGVGTGKRNRQNAHERAVEAILKDGYPGRFLATGPQDEDHAGRQAHNAKLSKMKETEGKKRNNASAKRSRERKETERANLKQQVRQLNFEVAFYRRQLIHRGGPAFVFDWEEHKRLEDEASAADQAAEALPPSKKRRVANKTAASKKATSTKRRPVTTTASTALSLGTGPADAGPSMVPGPVAPFNLAAPAASGPNAMFPPGSVRAPLSGPAPATRLGRQQQFEAATAAFSSIPITYGQPTDPTAAPSTYGQPPVDPAVVGYGAVDIDDGLPPVEGWMAALVAEDDNEGLHNNMRDADDPDAEYFPTPTARGGRKTRRGRR